MIRRPPLSLWEVTTYPWHHCRNSAGTHTPSLVYGCGGGGAIGNRSERYDLSSFIPVPIPLLLIRPAKRFVDRKTRSLGGKHGAFFQAIANRVVKPMVLLPRERHGQAAIQIPPLIGEL
jgi:hypothetical protein